MKKPKKYLFVTGGVMSSIGKGIAAASIGMLMESRGLRVTNVKMDPYLNVDPGTMSPFQHGEVFVLSDGSETDLDLGHYFRFIKGAQLSQKNSFTTGRIYDSVIQRERTGGYLGKTVQVIPHVTEEIKNHIRQAAQEFEITIIEVGGTVGDIESLPFLEAIRQMRQDEGEQNVLYIHLTYVPYLETSGELKTKPTQHSVKALREIGIQPDILLCRSQKKLPEEVKQKIGLFCNLTAQQVFSAVDVSSIYEVPLYFYEEGVDERIVSLLKMWIPAPNLSEWKAMVHRMKHATEEVRIGIVGKYVDWKDTYKSLHEALVHGATAEQLQVQLEYLDSEKLEQKDSDTQKKLHSVDAILVPGGFGDRGIEGKIQAIEYAREHQKPFLGICLGMQLSIVEFARHVLKIKNAHSEEFNSKGTDHVVTLMQSQKGIYKKGGTMRLGAYPCEIRKTFPSGKETLAYRLYQKTAISERHRHRYEVENKYRSRLEEAGFWATGRFLDPTSSLDLVEIIELENHPWFLGCQFHPEFLSRPLDPHPVFHGFIQAAYQVSKKKREKK